MGDKATLQIEGKAHEFPVITGTERERAIDIRDLRDRTGCITFDEGYANTGSCASKITFIDGENGVLRYRGIPIEELAEHSSFISTAHLLIYGQLPTLAERQAFREKLRYNSPIHVDMNAHFDGFPINSHPMAILSAMLNSLGCYYPEITGSREKDLDHFEHAAALILSKVRTIAAMSYRKEMGLPFIYPKRDLRYVENFLHMMFSEPYHDWEDRAGMADALDLFLMLHADHEQNCSTSTVRMVASGGANLFASVSAGVCALWGHLHGGANVEVIRMLEEIRDSGDDGKKFIAMAKSGKRRLMGFGHRVYKNYDPRARLLGKAAEKVLKQLGHQDKLLDIARQLEETARTDSYFIERKLYPNVDFYSGILLNAIGIPTEMFTVMFAIGRMAGWIANWKEVAENPGSRIYRPRQIYQGPGQRPYTRIRDR